MLHQGAFAADYQEDEYELLGRAIKYAGLRGKEVRVIGKNRSTLGEDDRMVLTSLSAALAPIPTRTRTRVD